MFTIIIDPKNDESITGYFLETSFKPERDYYIGESNFLNEFYECYRKNIQGNDVFLYKRKDDSNYDFDLLDYVYMFQNGSVLAYFSFFGYKFFEDEKRVLDLLNTMTSEWKYTHYESE